MKFNFNIIFLLLICACASTKNKINPNDIAITNASVVDVENGVILSDHTILIQQDRITALGLSSEIQIPENTFVVNVQDKFIIPGLWDMHVHLEIANKESLPVFIANGVTGVRDMGTDAFDSIKNWRDKVEEGVLIGPHILTPGPMLDGPFITDQLRVTVTSASEARAAVDSLVDMEVDFIKVHQQISREAYFAAADQAKKHNITLVGHRPNVVTTRELVEAGQKGIEHIFSVPDTASTSYSFLREKEVSVTPTLLLIDKIANYHTLSVESDPRMNLLSSSLIDFWKKQTEAWGVDVDKTAQMMQDLMPVMSNRVRLLHEAGVQLLAGTDLGVTFIYPGSSLHEELEVYVRAGLSPLEALQTATINPARFLDREESIGAIKVGRYADLVILDANPLKNISNTKKIYMVIFQGKIFDQEKIEKILN